MVAPVPTVPSRNVLGQSQNHAILPKSVGVKQAPPISSQIKPTQQLSLNRVSRRSSKPIINWFQRKLAGTVKPKRFSNSEGTPLQPVGVDAEAGRARGPTGVIPTARQPNRAVSSPLPVPSSSRRGSKQQSKPDATRRKTISLNEEDDKDLTALSRDDDEQSLYGSSFARESTWSPTMEADEDASVRPLPPSSPPSPSPSPSSSSYLSNPHTFRSIAASTKPTTVLSIDLAPNGVAHIAQVPGTPLSQVTRSPPHVRTVSTNANPGVLGSGTSVTFSALPPSPQSSSSPPSLLNPPSVGLANPGPQPISLHSPFSSVQAPLHTTHHPRNNPRPSSPPQDNASMLTLASSAFAFSSSRIMPGWGSTTPSAMGGGDSVSHFGGGAYADGESTSQFVMGDDERLEERDVDASVRALRPRSSRRGSWDSEASDWSAGMQSGGTPSFVRERSLWTTNSVRTGGQFSTENEETDRQSEEPIRVESTEVTSQFEAQSLPSSGVALDDGVDAPRQILPSILVEPAPSSGSVETPEASNQPLPPQIYDGHLRSTDAVTRLNLTDISSVTQEKPGDFRSEPDIDRADDDQSLTSPDQDMWHSAPSTPMM